MKFRKLLYNLIATTYKSARDDHNRLYRYIDVCLAFANEAQDEDVIQWLGECKYHDNDPRSAFLYYCTIYASIDTDGESRERSPYDPELGVPDVTGGEDISPELKKTMKSYMEAVVIYCKNY